MAITASAHGRLPIPMSASGTLARASAAVLELGRWYVVHSKPYREEIAQFHLQRKGLTVFFPQLLLPQPPPRRQRIVPLFPGYLFIQAPAPVEYDSVRWSPYVKYVVNFNGIPAPLDEKIVTFLRQCATTAGVLTARSIVIAGQEGENMEGSYPYTSLVSMVRNPHNSRDRVRMLMQLFSH